MIDPGREQLENARIRNLEITIRHYAAAAIRAERRAEALAFQLAAAEERLAVLGVTSYGED